MDPVVRQKYSRIQKWSTNFKLKTMIQYKLNNLTKSNGQRNLFYLGIKHII